MKTLKILTFIIAFVGMTATVLQAGEGRVERFRERVQLRTEDASDKLPEYKQSTSGERAEYDFYERIELRTEDASDKLPQQKPVNTEAVRAEPNNIPEGCFDSDHADQKMKCIEKWHERTEDRIEAQHS